MIQLIYGAKGSGKTKRIIDLANTSVAKTDGNIIFITDTNRYMYDIKHEIRAINVCDHNIHDSEALIGFVKGLIAGNHDIKEIFIDGAHRIAQKDVCEMQDFYDELEGVAERQGVIFVVAVSKDVSEFPDFLKKYLK